LPAIVLALLMVSSVLIGVVVAGGDHAVPV
jgi:hypothetical protein